MSQKGFISLSSLGSIVGAIISAVVTVTSPIGTTIEQHINPIIHPISISSPLPSVSVPNSQGSHDISINVGFQTRTVSYTTPAGVSKTLNYAIWYPTASAMKMYNYNRTLAPGGLVALNAPVLKNHVPSGYPLVVLSHGAGGCATAYVYIESYLASRGYIVAAPDHEDALVCTINGGKGSGKTINPEDRPADISEVISQMLSQNQNPASPFYNTINPSEIAVTGHSAGGMTALQISGVESQDKDHRVKAAMMLAEDTGSYTPSEYAQINIPTMFEIGQFDKSARTAGDTPRDIPFIYAQTPKYLYEDRGDSHLAFDDTICEGYSSINACQTSNVRAANILKTASSFLSNYLLNSSSNTAALINQRGLFTGYVCFSYQLPGQQLINPSCLSTFPSPSPFSSATPSTSTPTSFRTTLRSRLSTPEPSTSTAPSSTIQSTYNSPIRNRIGR